MDDIFDNEEVDKDTVKTEILNKLFENNYSLLTETSVTLKNSYVNKLHGTKSLKVAVSLSEDSSIEVFDLNKSSLSSVCRLNGHDSEKALTEVVFSPKDDQLLYSAGEDGLVKLWDLRTSAKCVQEYKDEDEELIKPYECMDVSCNGRVLCAGSQLVQDEAYLVFWDQRMTKPLGGYWNSHTDDITQVKFHKEKTEILITGSLDGLLNVFNVMEQDEDDALTFSFNVENAVEKITWLDSKQVACTTPSHDMQIWDTNSGDLLKSYNRDKIAKAIKRSKVDDVYLVDAYLSIDNTPVLLAGSNGGDENVLRSVTVTEKKLQPRGNFMQNKQFVRCCWYDKERDILVTAGEAGLVSAWSRGGSAALKLPHAAHKHANRHKPY